MKRFTYWIPSVLLCILIFTLSSRPRISLSDKSVVDFIIFKSLHMLEYGLLMIFNYRALLNSYHGLNKKQLSLFSFLATLLYAVSDEIHQTYVPTREGRLRDVGFDTIGTLLALLFIWKLQPIVQSRLLKLVKNWGKS